jgi:hypothetical protein
MASSLSPHVILLAFWLVMALFAAFFLRMACGICGVNLPSWRRSFISVLIVTFLAYVAFDFTGYLILRSMQGVTIQLPEGYGYHLWFREPIGLKLFIISQGGPLKYIPYVNALCAAGVLQVIVLEAQVTFRMGLVVFALQWAATLVAGYLLSLVMGVGLEALGWKPEPPPAAPTPADQAREQAKAKQARRPGGRRVARAPKGPRGKKTAEIPEGAKDREGAEGEKADSVQGSLQVIQREAGDAAKATGEYLKEAGENLKDYAESHLEEVKEDLAPVVERLPEPVQQFLDKGGWWVVFGAAAVILLIWLRAILRRLAGALRPRRKKRRPKSKKVAVNLKEKLKDIGEAYTEEGPRQITVKGLPARLRLVILSRGSRTAGELSAEMVDRVLDWIKPGLAEVTSGDYPRVKVWPLFYSHSGFATAFANNVVIPEPKGEPSRWVLVTGQVAMGKAVLHVGMALYADEETTLRHLAVKNEHWLSVLGVQDTRQPAGAR